VLELHSVFPFAIMSMPIKAIYPTMSAVPAILQGDSDSCKIVISKRKAKTICVLVTSVAVAALSHRVSPIFVNNCPKKPARPKPTNTSSSFGDGFPMTFHEPPSSKCCPSGAERAEKTAYMFHPT
jgi:hypothetical protein